MSSIQFKQVTKHIEVPQVQFLNKVDEMPVGVQRQISMVQTVQKTMEIPRMQTVEKIAETSQTQTMQATQTPQSLGTTTDGTCGCDRDRNVPDPGSARSRDFRGGFNVN